MLSPIRTTILVLLLCCAVSPLASSSEDGAWLVLQLRPGSGIGVGASGLIQTLPHPVALMDGVVIRTLSREQRAAFESAEAGDAAARRWLRLRCGNAAEAAAAERLLEMLPSVLKVFRARQVFPAGTAEQAQTAPSFFAEQGYLDKAPHGVNMRYAWRQPGGAGAGVRIADIEGDWNKKHLDLRLKGRPIRGVRAGKSTSWYNHGTAVAGVLNSRKNGHGTVGIAYEARMFPFSVFRRDREGRMFGNVADAVLWATRRLRPGDILLIEVQLSGIERPADFLPAEFQEDVFFAIRRAIRKGVIVVQAAGNGEQDLDDPLFKGRFDRSFRDSGALFVGAAGAPELPEDLVGSETGSRSPLSFSNYGSRLDLQAWGELVVTTGYGDLYLVDGPHEPYTRFFRGTSSAAAIVAGVCASLQGVARERLGRPLTPEEMRTILVDTGRPQQGRLERHIGPQPDLKAAIRALEGMQP